jgi:hypothetical protein
MFIRFRGIRRLRVSIVETRCVGRGRVRSTHIASLGSVAVPATAPSRFAFWECVNDRFAELANLIDGEVQAMLLSSILVRIPTLTADELRALQAERALQQAIVAATAVDDDAFVLSAEDRRRLMKEIARLEGEDAWGEG